jgi:hypothetical protein
LAARRTDRMPRKRHKPEESAKLTLPMDHPVGAGH